MDDPPMGSQEQNAEGLASGEDPRHLPDAPVPWERSDARSMRPAEQGGQVPDAEPGRTGGPVRERRPDEPPPHPGPAPEQYGLRESRTRDHEPSDALTTPDAGPAPG